MKKVLLATVLAVTTMSAMAQTTIYGQMRVFTDSTQTGNTKVTSITNNASRLGVSVNENLGNGLVARAVLETSIAADDPKTGSDTQFGDRQSTVGLASKLGSVDLGRKEHFQYVTLKSVDPFSGLYGSIANDIHNTRNSRVGDAAFLSLTPFKNLSLAAEKTQTGLGGDATILGASTELLGVKTSVARFEQGLEKSTVLGLGTKLLGANVSYAYSDNEGTAARRGQTLGVTVPVGIVTAKASYGKTNTDITAYSLGAEYDFSKRTALHVAYRNVNKAGSANDVEQVGVGLIHRF